MTLPMGALGFLTDIEVRVTVELGATSMRLRDICQLTEDRVVPLDRLVDEPLELLVNGKAVARGEVVSEGSRFGLRIIELIGQDGGAFQEADTKQAPSAALSAGGKPRAERRAAPPTVEKM